MPDEMPPTSLRLQEQVAYYRARAGEYDEWFHRTGRYDRGDAHRREWFAEIEAVRHALTALGPPRHVLELACGTGLWTDRLVGPATHVLAVDASPEAIAINRQRVGPARVDYVEADLFAWEPPRHAFDLIFFGFWLSHVPDDRFDAFWTRVASALAPGGRVFFVDSLLEPDSAARDHAAPDRSGVAERRLNDGRTFHIVKIFHDPAALEARLAVRGWRGSVTSTGRFFLYGSLSWRR